MFIEVYHTYDDEDFCKRIYGPPIYDDYVAIVTEEAEDGVNVQDDLALPKFDPIEGLLRDQAFRYKGEYVKLICTLSAAFAWDSDMAQGHVLTSCFARLIHPYAKVNIDEIIGDLNKFKKTLILGVVVKGPTTKHPRTSVLMILPLATIVLLSLSLSHGESFLLRPNSVKISLERERSILVLHLCGRACVAGEAKLPSDPIAEGIFFLNRLLFFLYRPDFLSLSIVYSRRSKNEEEAIAGVGPMTQDWEPVVIRKKTPNAAAKHDEKTVNAARRSGAEIESAEDGVNPDDSRIPPFIADMEGKSYTFQVRVTAYNFTSSHKTLIFSIVDELGRVRDDDVDDNGGNEDDDDNMPNGKPAPVGFASGRATGNGSDGSIRYCA
ncbi:hypothetical protein F2Q68_00040292 [Brassica cretica]|uniref:Multiprotein bridging factor 1 N-terminal domain-containing protein n=1 Tax=Brassica cretica TaxID=69181 RepID=A0A8S9MMF8_BRACR|nr:hypothetical protein F2Q68_00040292 [Brassica cretica]